MKIDPVIQQTSDFDWFGVDEDGLIGHFTTAGFKFLPSSVASAGEDLRSVTNFFRNTVIRGSHKVDDASLTSALGREWKGQTNEARYLRDFVAMANKGLFSHDIDSYLRPGICYFRVALPENPLTLGELPEQIRRIVSRTILKDLRLTTDGSVLYEATLRM